ncbi:MAG TPA: aldo/keto reductase [Sphingobium sp.]
MVELRPLGNSGLEIAPLVLGGNVFGVNGMDRAKSFAVLDAFVGGGGTMLDTADYYSAYLPEGKGGESETMIGEWLASRGGRDRIQIATKVGGVMGPGLGGLGKDYLPKAVDASLRRLGTDFIDVYFAHFDDPNVPQEEVVEAFDKLVRAGKVRSVGASNFTPARFASALDIALANGLTPYTVFQPQYNLLERDLETELLPLCLARGVVTITFFALAQGYLTGKYRGEADLSQSRRGRNVRKYMEGRGPAILAVLDEISTRRAVSHAAIALAWVAAKPGVTAPIASATSVEQLDDLLPSLTLTLSPEEMARLDDAA